MTPKTPDPHRSHSDRTPPYRLVSSLIQRGEVESVDWLSALQSLEQPGERVRAILLGRIGGAAPEPLLRALLDLGIHPLSAHLFSLFEWKTLGIKQNDYEIGSFGLFGSSSGEYESEDWITGPPCLRETLTGERPPDWPKSPLRLVVPPGLAYVELSGDLTGMIDPTRTFGPELRLFNARGEVELPANFSRDLLIHHCTARFQFQDHLLPWRRLEIRDCPNLTGLPDIECVETLLLEHCPALKDLPPIFFWPRPTVELVALPVTKLDLFQQPSECRQHDHERNVPDPFQRLRLEKLVHLREFVWHPDASVLHLEILDCPCLETWPEALTHVKGDLVLEGLPGLRTLPEGLRVDGCLTIRGCTNLSQHWRDKSGARGVGCMGNVDANSQPTHIHER